MVGKNSILKLLLVYFGVIFFIFIILFKDTMYDFSLLVNHEIKQFKFLQGKIDNNETIIKYNGTTIEEAVKSNRLIDEKTKEITQGCSSDIEKARKIYVWIGSNIEYDTDKAEEVVNDNNECKESGAIYAYRDRSGVCFDYACLYVAMARSANLKVRLITGEAYNGTEYASHAWNQIYSKEEKRWINVDSTFFNGGNYFDSNNFEKYRNSEVACEW